MKDLSSHQFSDMYAKMGVDVKKLGCIMANVESIKVTDIIAEEDLYYSSDPLLSWIDGATSEKVAHVTLLYGLMESGPRWKEYVDTVLEGWSMKTVEVSHVSTFTSKYENEPYICIIAELTLTDELLEANARLRFLPHIDTFPLYRAHVTLAYVDKDAKDLGEYLYGLNNRLAGNRLRVTGLNYGSDK